MCIVLNATFSNISAISWRSVLLVEEGECTRLAPASDKAYHLPIVGGSLRVLRLLPPLKLVAMIQLKVALSTINQIKLNHQNKAIIKRLLSPIERKVFHNSEVIRKKNPRQYFYYQQYLCRYHEYTFPSMDFVHDAHENIAFQEAFSLYLLHIFDLI